MFPNILPLGSIHEKYNIDMNLFEHYSINLKLKEYLKFQDKPETTVPSPRNNSKINILLNIDKNGGLKPLQDITATKGE